MMTLSQILSAARKYAPQASMRSSADLCLSDATALHAGQRALASLAYSLGIFSPVYQEAKASLDANEASLRQFSGPLKYGVVCGKGASPRDVKTAKRRATKRTRDAANAIR